MEATSEAHPAPAGAPAARDNGAVRGALPNLIVIGAQKCGISALHYYPGLHPEISMSRTKELNFFIRQRNWDRGVEWYRQQFDPRAVVRGETSPNYTAYPQFGGVPRRMHSLVPDAKLVYIVRDPLERIAAHWVHNYAKGRIDHPLGLRELRNRRGNIARTRYRWQLMKFLRRYPLERILLLDQDDLRQRREDALRRVFEFAEVDPGFTHPRFRREQHKTEREVRATRLGKAAGRPPRPRAPPPSARSGLDAGERALATRPDRPPQRARGALHGRSRGRAGSGPIARADCVRSRPRPSGQVRHHASR
jgi:hypothetical protein